MMTFGAFKLYLCLYIQNYWWVSRKISCFLVLFSSEYFWCRKFLGLCNCSTPEAEREGKAADGNQIIVEIIPYPANLKAHQAKFNLGTVSITTAPS